LLSNEKLNINTLIDSYNLLEEPIILFDKNCNIIGYNDYAKYSLGKDNIEIDLKQKIKKIVFENENSIEKNHYEIELKNINNDNFIAIIHSNSVFVDNEKVLIFTIINVTKIKEEEIKLLEDSKSQIKSLKSHLITKISQANQETNKIKAFHLEEFNKINEKNKTFQLVIGKLKEKVVDLENINIELKKEIDNLKQESFSFKDLLELQINRSKETGEKFSLILVTIDNFNELKNNFETKNKLELIIKATTRHIKNKLRNFDMVFNIKDGIFYVIAVNVNSDFNTSVFVERISRTETLLGEYSIKFSAGMTFFYKEDTFEQMTYRTMVNHSSKINEITSVMMENK
jgi:GGDEF domain-containing protein